MDRTTTIDAVTQIPRYAQLIERAKKTVSEIDTSLNSLEKQLEPVLESQEPKPEKSQSKGEQAPKCKLEESLLGLCQEIEVRLETIQILYQRIRL